MKPSKQWPSVNKRPEQYLLPILAGLCQNVNEIAKKWGENFIPDPSLTRPFSLSTELYLVVPSSYALALSGPF